MADRRELCVGGKPLSSLRVVDLKVELEKRSLPKSGSKKELLERLRLHLQLEETREAALKDEDHVPNLSLCNETENDFVREYLAAQQARFQVQKEAKKQYEEKVRESEASAEETTQDEDEPSDYSPARKVSPKKTTRSKRKEELTSTPVANKEISKFQTPESVSTLREEETPSQDDDTTEEEEVRTPRTRKHKLLKYVQAPSGSERRHQAGKSVTGQGHVEQLHAGRRRDPPPSQLYGDAGAIDSQSPAPAGSSKTSTSAESSESETVLPRVVDVWSEKESKTEAKPSVPEPAPQQEEEAPIEVPKEPERIKDKAKASAEVPKASEEPKEEIKAPIEKPKEEAKAPVEEQKEEVKAPIEELNEEAKAAIEEPDEEAKVPAELAVEPVELKDEIVAPIITRKEPEEPIIEVKPVEVEEPKPELTEIPKEEASAVKPTDEPAPIDTVESPKRSENADTDEDLPPELTKIEKTEDHELSEPIKDHASESTVSLQVKAEDEQQAVEIEDKNDMPPEISMEGSQEKLEEQVKCEIPAEENDEEMKEVQSEDAADKKVEQVEKRAEETKSEEPANNTKEMEVVESKEEKAPTPTPLEDVLTIEAEPEPLDQPDSSENKDENKSPESVEVSMAVEKEKSPQPEARPESREEIKSQRLDESTLPTSDNEEDELQVDASELIDDSLRITAADEIEDKQESRSNPASRSESRQSVEGKAETKETETEPVETEEKAASPEPIKHEPVRKLKIKKSQPQAEQTTEVMENGSLRKRRWGTSNLLPNKKPALVISTESLKAIVPDAKPLSAEEVRLGSPNFQPAKQPTAPATEEDNEPKTEKPEIVRRVAVEVAEAIAPAKPEAVIAAAAPLLEATSPAQQPRSCVLQVSNLVRPFTVNQLKDLLARTGHLIDGKFWMDKVKSTCLVQYETEDEAEETRSALHGIHWPTSNPKTLIVDFSTIEQLENRLAGKDLPSGAAVKAETRPAPVAAVVDEAKRERPERVREWDLGKVNEAETDRPGKENRTADDEIAEVKAKDDVPAKLLDDLFRKTKAAPCIYWLPLTDAQIAEKEEMRRQRLAEREKRERETKQRKEEEYQERQRAREKQREDERERQRARERQRTRKRSHSSSSSSSRGSASPAKRRTSRSPPPRRR